MLWAASFSQVVKFSAKNDIKHRNNEKIQNLGQSMKFQMLLFRGKLEIAISLLCSIFHGR